MIRAILLALVSLAVAGCVQTGARPAPRYGGGVALLVAEWQPGVTRLRAVQASGESAPLAEFGDLSPYGLRFQISPESGWLSAVRLRSAGSVLGADGEVWIARIGESAFRHVASGADVRSPAMVSADGSTIAFRRHGLGPAGTERDEIWFAPTDGGPPVLQVEAEGALGLALVGWRGDVLWYVSYYEDRSVIRSSDGRAIEVVGAPPIRDARLEPTGDRIAFLLLERDGADRESSARIEVRSPAGDRQVIKTGLPFAGLAWKPDGSLALSLGPGGQVPPDLPFAVELIPGSRQLIDLPVVFSPDGSLLAVRRIHLNTDGTPLSERVGLRDRDGAFHPITTNGFAEAIGWTGP